MKLIWLCEPGDKSYKPQYFFSISMKNCCLLTLVYKFIIRLAGKFFLYHYMLGSTVHCMKVYQEMQIEITHRASTIDLNLILLKNITVILSILRYQMNNALTYILIRISKLTLLHLEEQCVSQ